MQRRYSITRIALFLLTLMMLAVSCGNDPFFHNVTVKNYKGETVNSFIHYDGDFYTFPAEMNGFTNIVEWVYDGRTYNIGAQVNFSEDSVITAVTGHVLSVDNGNDTDQSLVVREYDTTFTLPEAPPERTGYVFDGWLVDNVLKNASDVVAFSPDMQIEAKWTEIYTVTYDANNGTGTVAPTILRDDQNSVKLSNGSGFTNGSLRLTSWNTSADGNGTGYKPGADYSEKASVTLYAVWTNLVTVSFNLDGGNGTTGFNDQTFVSGGTAQRPTATPTHIGWTFLGWTDTYGGTTAFNFNTPITEDTILYAMWTKSYAIGATGPAGGKIFYDNPNWAADGWRYLEAATTDAGTYEWGLYAATMETNFGTESGIGKGKTNTDKLKNSGISNFPAAKACVDFREGGYSDWFLPSDKELELLYNNRVAIGNFNCATNNDGVYWASTEGTSGNYIFAAMLCFGTGRGDAKTYARHYTLKVRPVRYF